MKNVCERGGRTSTVLEIPEYYSLMEKFVEKFLIVCEFYFMI